MVTICVAIVLYNLFDRLSLPFPSLHMLSAFGRSSRLVFRNPIGLSKHSLAPLHTTARIMAQQYKIKGLSSLDLKPGEKREVEVEGIAEGKVLLANVGGTTHALSSKCTHFGAPMKLGVLTPDGRLTCAWHGGELRSTKCRLVRRY